MEMIDHLTLNAVEDAHHMGLQRDAGALLIVELDGPRAGIMEHRAIVEKCLAANSVSGVTWAKDPKERAKIWKARKTSFGALGRIAPHAYVLDGVIPRSKLAEAIERIEAIGKKHDRIIANVYHAGDGNLHPTILYHKDRQSEVDATLRAGREILEVCVELGGTLSGEHGIGVEKILEMERAFSPDDLEAMGWVKHAFNPDGLCNPGKVLPTPKSCGESGGRAMRRHMLSASSVC
jgi:glycolate oxidase